MEGAGNPLRRANAWLWNRAKQSIAGSLRRDVDQRGDALVLAKSFVVSEEKRVILPNRPPGGSSELVPPEFRDRRTIKVISSVERAVTQELIGITVELIGPGFCNSVDDATRGPPILG